MIVWEPPGVPFTTSDRREFGRQLRGLAVSDPTFTALGEYPVVQHRGGVEQQYVLRVYVRDVI